MLEVLPKGERDDPDSCPCGLATGAHVGYKSFWPESDALGMGKPLPEAVQQFVVAFDEGHLPQYDQFAAEEEEWPAEEDEEE